ncbi:phosphoglucosamine mutase [Candidatus Sumerlaeota bacterium]|nr:phosphoglucosamine mutase [Candidatus Sumerlaeota bacterium]
MARGQLMVSVAGIRGVVADTLTPEVVLSYAQAFAAERAGKTVVVGGDTRLSRPWIERIVEGALIDAGCRVVQIGICPTPTVGFTVRRLGAAGGIAITASHNPAEWNALKFFSSKGIFLNPAEFAKLKRRLDARRFVHRPFDKIGAVEHDTKAIDHHLRAVLKILKKPLIRKRRFRVVVDCVNGAGSVIARPLLGALDCRVKWLYDATDRVFPREEAEPLPHNLVELGETVRAWRADVGFAIDPDADRLAVVDEQGRPLGEDRTLTLAAEAWLPRCKTPIVVNNSTSSAIDDIAARFGLPVHRTKIGEAHVVKKMLEIGSEFGGEGGGGVIVPAVQPGRDAATAIGLVLEAMARDRAGRAISEINADTPLYEIAKDKVVLPPERVDGILEELERLWPDEGKRDRLDGLKIHGERSWAHVRASGTEPIVRIYCEAPTGKQATKLRNQAKRLLRQASKG